MSSTPSPQAPLLVERRGATVHLCFNRPHALNAVDVPMAHALLEAMRTLTSDTTERAEATHAHDRSTAGLERLIHAAAARACGVDGLRGVARLARESIHRALRILGANHHRDIKWR